MRILLTGIDGYIGWPTALRLSKRYPDAEILGVDNYGRRRWVEEGGAVSAIPVSSMAERLEAAKKHGFKNIRFQELDLVDRAKVYEVLRTFKPDVILHAAAQPSAPYSEVSGERANYTQNNNVQGTRNLLWGLKENGLLETLFIETTTTGIYGAPEFEIPEGYFEVEHKGGRDTLPFPAMAGSWYHMSKAMDALNLWIANRQWKLTVVDIRTSIIFGAATTETVLDPKLSTRFDFDFDFGVVANRFCVMALAGEPITVYGKGEQKKPQLSLEDAVESLVNAVTLPRDKKMTVYNQTAELFSIVDLANAVKKGAAKLNIHAEIAFIPNPRVEKEEHDMKMANDRFLKLLNKKPLRFEDNIIRIMEKLAPFKQRILDHKHTFIRETKVKAAVK